MKTATPINPYPAKSGRSPGAGRKGSRGAGGGGGGGAGGGGGRRGPQPGDRPPAPPQRDVTGGDAVAEGALGRDADGAPERSRAGDQDRPQRPAARAP